MPLVTLGPTFAARSSVGYRPPERLRLAGSRLTSPVRLRTRKVVYTLKVTIYKDQGFSLALFNILIL